MLKIATLDDLPVLLEMGMKFASTTACKDYMERDHIANVMHACITSPDKVMLMHGEDAFLMGGVMPFQYGPYLTASELAWWVNEDKRKSTIGTELLEAFEFWAQKVGATFVHMVSLDDRVGKYYERKGYKLLERAYIKEI